MVGVIVVLLLVLPFVELAVLIATVDLVGLWPALAAIVVVGIAGGWLVKRQGIGVWRRAEGRLRDGKVPSTEVVNGLLVLIAGGLLLLPGFLSDVLALALLLPPVRAVVRSLLFRRFEQRVESTLAGPVGFAFGEERPRVNAGVATYDVREVREVRPAGETGPGGPGQPRPGRP
jgi:UPF0716 protein FxsA